MAETFGAKIDFIGLTAQSPDRAFFETDTPLPPELDETPETSKACQMVSERGFTEIQILERHGLFHGLGASASVYQLHGGELKSVPPSFKMLAEGELCRVQALSGESSPIYGTQFHPEMYDDCHPDGKKILQNFFVIAGIMSQIGSGATS
jgi:gamma-glutamyl-gamma-aminobutyrate hydrolase PuuD